MLNLGVFTKIKVAKEFSQFGSICCNVMEAADSFTILKFFGVTSFMEAPTVLKDFELNFSVSNSLGAFY